MKTASIHDFKWGYGDRTASIRIPYAVRDRKAPGYLWKIEDPSF